MASPLTPRLPRRVPWISELRRPRPDVRLLETRLLAGVSPGPPPAPPPRATAG